jgi:predicted RNA methylase
VGAKAARRSLGLYYSPAESAQRLVASTGWSAGAAGLLRCADAACGTGELLVAAWELAPTGAEVHCFGFEVDAVAAAVTRARLMLRRRACGLAWGAVAGWVVCADALTALPPWPTAFELVVGNPPFGNAIERETARTAGQTALLRQRFPHAARGAFDRAAIFAELSLSWAGTGGCVALVLPRAMQSVAYASGLRERLGVEKSFYAVENTRGGISKASMIHNDATPEKQRQVEIHFRGEGMHWRPPAQSQKVTINDLVKLDPVNPINRAPYQPRKPWHAGGGGYDTAMAC